MKTATTLGIGVIGTGIMGADHIKTITTAVFGAQVRAIADIDPKRAEAIALTVPGAKALSSAEDLISAPEVDAVLIASSDATHARYVIASIAARKPVLCEKPLAPTIVECEEILRLEQAAGLRLVQTGFNRRFDPSFVELRSRIASGSSALRCSRIACTAMSVYRPVGHQKPPYGARLRMRSMLCLGSFVRR